MTTPAEEPTPRLVRSYGYDAPELENVTDSAQPKFWPQGPKPVVYSHPATHAAQRAAFQQYETRPDIESRNSILAREHAQPGEFLPAQLAAGTVPGERDEKLDMTRAAEVGPYKALPNDLANLATDDPSEVYAVETLTPYFGEVDEPASDGAGSSPRDGLQGPVGATFGDEPVTEGGDTGGGEDVAPEEPQP